MDVWFLCLTVSYSLGWNWKSCALWNTGFSCMNNCWLNSWIIWEKDRWGIINSRQKNPFWASRADLRRHLPFEANDRWLLHIFALILPHSRFESFIVNSAVCETHMENWKSIFLSTNYKHLAKQHRNISRTFKYQFKRYRNCDVSL